MRRRGITIEFMGMEVKSLDRTLEIWAAKTFTEDSNERNEFVEVGDTAVFVDITDADFEYEYMTDREEVDKGNFVDIFAVARGKVKIGEEDKDIITVTLLAKALELDEAERQFGKVRV